MRIVSVVGARPQFVKAAAVSREVERRRAGGDATVEEVLVHTGQHYDARMSDAFFEELGLATPDHHLGVGSGRHGEQTGEMLRRIEEVLLEESPAAVTVYGDTNSTLAAGLAAAKLGIPVVHVEAGLRSFDRSMPEEVNRVLVDHVAELLLCPSEVAVGNLAREGITAGVHVVGDVMHDVLRWQRGRPDRPDPVSMLGLQRGGYVLVTIHRPANTDHPDTLRRIAGALTAVAARGLDVVFPVHPRTANLLVEDLPGVRMIEPIGHADCLALAADAAVVLTDSGGLQKEAYWLATPCVTLRDTTEWTETVATGWNQLVATDPAAVVAAVLGAGRPEAHPELYGDGQAAGRIVEFLEQLVAQPR